MVLVSEDIYHNFFIVKYFPLKKNLKVSINIFKLFKENLNDKYLFFHLFLKIIMSKGQIVPSTDLTLIRVFHVDTIAKTSLACVS